MAGLLDALKQYIADSLPGGLLNPETKPVANQAKYVGGLLDPNSPISQDAQNWHKRTQIGLADQLAGRQTPEAEQAYQTMMQAAGMAPVGMIAWHGSPHKFDKFSLDKIGTGEGAQAYGHGAYLGEARAVGEEYMRKLAGKENTGYLYKTDIPDEAVARFLDWDKQITPDVLDALKVHPELSGYIDGYKFGGGVKGQTGEMLYRDLGRFADDANNEAGQFTATELLRKAGIPGIRYLDGGSRGTGSGTSNFVAFDPEMIRILERNGVPTGQVPWKPGEYQNKLAGLLDNGGMDRPYPTTKEGIQGAAEAFAEKLNKMGFDAKVEHSGSKAGPSSYVRVFDPQTGRFLVDPVRFSGHSKGPKESALVNNVLTAGDIDKYMQVILDMRAKGPAEFMKKQLAKNAK